ncbi:MAG: hypothetical protein CEN91_577 [Candidatus Berkelbacteria bacterium Licking1014_85]|uniref:Response regulatory domain-containing protein n=1 Tax=Candidatus Berkelbacteria bacterium Licking1014_85 TaxID=2017148 RepID=A0A554LG73_9BACT|nr:MAG: hypothetical protein CEN91_577 [Candidatus Berkelbacteria bacterium Licking1014_85]
MEKFVLVIDDDEKYLEYMKEILVEAGFRVETACTYEQAIETINTRSAEILGIVCDTVLNDDSNGNTQYGFGILAHVFNTMPKLPFPFIAISSENSMEWHWIENNFTEHEPDPKWQFVPKSASPQDFVETFISLLLLPDE